MALGGLVSQRKGFGAIRNLNTRNPPVFSSRNVSQKSRRFTRRFVSLRFHSLVSCWLLLSLYALPMSGFKQLRNVPMCVNNHEVCDLQPHHGQACGCSLVWLGVPVLFVKGSSNNKSKERQKVQ